MCRGFAFLDSYLWSHTSTTLGCGTASSNNCGGESDAEPGFEDAFDHCHNQFHRELLLFEEVGNSLPLPLVAAVAVTKEEVVERLVLSLVDPFEEQLGERAVNVDWRVFEFAPSERQTTAITFAAYALLRLVVVRVWTRTVTRPCSMLAVPWVIRIPERECSRVDATLLHTHGRLLPLLGSDGRLQSHVFGANVPFQVGEKRLPIEIFAARALQSERQLEEQLEHLEPSWVENEVFVPHNVEVHVHGLRDATMGVYGVEHHIHNLLCFRRRHSEILH